MRSIDLLVRTYPEKTCAEIMQIVEQEKKAEEKRVEKFTKKKIDTVKDINENGCYYKGTFGLDQYFAYNFKNAEFKWNEIICDVEHITIFTNNNDKSKDRDLHVEIRLETMKEFEKYGVQMYEKITKEEFEEIKNYYVGGMPKFWTPIDPNK